MNQTMRQRYGLTATQAAGNIKAIHSAIAASRSAGLAKYQEVAEATRRHHDFVARDIAQAAARFDRAMADAEVRRSTERRRRKPQAVRQHTFAEKVTAFCEAFCKHGWLLLVGIVIAAAILNARAQGGMP